MKRNSWRAAMLAALSLFTMLASAICVSPAYAVDTPSWWVGECDVSNNPNSYPLRASFNGVKACGPRPLYTTQADYTVHFYSGAWGELEWECVELVVRYMYQVYGIAPYSANGYEVVSNYGGTRLSKVQNDATALRTPGDILAFGISTNHPGVGHTAVVTAVNVTSGSGTITYMQENASADGWGSVAVTAGVLGDGITGWLHDPNYSPTSTATPKRLDYNGDTLGLLHG